MEDISVTLKALLLLVVVLVVVVGSAVISPLAFVLLFVALAWVNLVGLVLITRI